MTRTRSLLDYEREHERASRSPILMVNRRRFDLALVTHAVQIGGGSVELRDGVRVVSVSEEESRVVVGCEGGERLSARYLVAADGAFSPTARALGLSRGSARPGVALDAEVTVVPEIWDVEKERATFNFFCVPNGYGWIFPKGEQLSCGIGVWRGKRSMQKELTTFLEKSLPEGSILSVERSGHAIPLHHEQREVATRRVCLVGDAASLADPILGEGIRFALKSGTMAAELVLELLDPGRTADGRHEYDAAADCRAYGPRLQAAIGSHFDALQKIAQTIFFEAPEYFYETFVIGDERYGRLSRQIVQQMESLRSAG